MQADRPQNDVVIKGFDFQRFPGLQLQPLTYRFRENDAARLIYVEFGIHDGIIPFSLPSALPFPAGKRTRKGPDSSGPQVTSPNLKASRRKHVSVNIKLLLVQRRIRLYDNGLLYELFHFVQKP